jgi:hypothetical protein
MTINLVTVTWHQCTSIPSSVCPHYISTDSSLTFFLDINITYAITQPFNAPGVIGDVFRASFEDGASSNHCELSCAPSLSLLMCLTFDSSSQYVSSGKCSPLACLSISSHLTWVFTSWNCRLQCTSCPTFLHSHFSLGTYISPPLPLFSWMTKPPSPPLSHSTSYNMSGCTIASDSSFLSPSKIDFYNDPDNTTPVTGTSSDTKTPQYQQE